jgi:ATP/maltotriose-dependent transcriptional regulator MalT
MVTTGEQESTELAEETDLSEIDMLSGVKLTDMERRVISLILGGCSNSDMCHITGLSSARLKTILRGLSRKLER